MNHIKIISILFVLCVGLTGCAAAQRQAKVENPDEAFYQAEPETGKENAPQTSVQLTKLASFRSKESVGIYEYTAGTYTVGVDFPAGTYIVERLSGHDKILITDKSGNVLQSGQLGETIYGDLLGFKNLALPDGSMITVYGNLNVRFIKQ